MLCPINHGFAYVNTQCSAHKPVSGHLFLLSQSSIISVIADLNSVSIPSSLPYHKVISIQPQNSVDISAHEIMPNFLLSVAPTLAKAYQESVQVNGSHSQCQHWSYDVQGHAHMLCSNSNLNICHLLMRLNSPLPYSPQSLCICSYIHHLPMPRT